MLRTLVVRRPRVRSKNILAAEDTGKVFALCATFIMTILDLAPKLTTV